VVSQGQELELFLESCRSEETKKHYSICLRKYLNFAGEGKLSFNDPNPKSIEEKIIEFIISLKKEGKSYRAIVNYIAPVKSLYAINGIQLNTKKIEKFLPESRKIKIDRAYEHEEISKLLQIADERKRVVILFLASSGIRIGAAPHLTCRQHKK
jgi:Phage integrase, N-terminal SAM-like domain